MGGDRGGGSGRWQPADFEQLEPERLDLREHAVKRGAVGQRPGQHGVAAAGPGLQGGERRAYRLAEGAADTDAVPVRRPVSVGAGHVLTTHAVNRAAGGSAVIGTGTGDPLLRQRILTVSRGVGRAAAGARSRVISGTIGASGRRHDRAQRAAGRLAWLRSSAGTSCRAGAVPRPVSQPSSGLGLLFRVALNSLPCPGGCWLRASRRSA